MPHFDKLTNKEKSFVIEKVKGKTATQAVMDSYEVSSRESAKVIGSQLMAKPEIKMSITELMEHCGIDKPYRIRRLKQVIDSSDLNIAHKGLDMSFKLDGSYAPEKHINIDAIFEISPEEEARLRKLGEQLLQQMEEEEEETKVVENEN